MKLIYKDFAISIKAAGEQKNTIRAVFSTPIEDRHGEIVDQTGWVLDEFLKNPVVLFGHDHFQPAIGKVNDIGIVDGNLEGVIEFAAEQYDFAKTIYNLYVGGFMRAISVGYMNVEQDVQNDVVVHRKNVLYEVSCVNVPANALALAKSKGIDVSPIENMQKTVVPYNAYPIADEGLEWTNDEAIARVKVWAGGSAKEDIDFAKYSKAFAWFDETDKENFGSYKLPHHDVIDGDVKTVWRGVAAAMSALLGGRGGVDIPDGDREAVYNHLAKHYKQFDKEVPEFKSYSADELKEIEETGMISKSAPKEKIGRVLSKKNRTHVENAKKALEEVLVADQEEEQSADTTGTKHKGQKPLSSQGVQKRIAIRLINKAVRSLLEEKNQIIKS